MSGEVYQGYRRVVSGNAVEYQVDLPVARELVGRVLALCDAELGGARTRDPDTVWISAWPDGSVLVFRFVRMAMPGEPGDSL